MKVLVAAAVLLIMLVRVNSVPLDLGAPSESYLQEVREQLEERSQESEENQHHRETRSASDNTADKATRCGSYIHICNSDTKGLWSTNDMLFFPPDNSTHEPVRHGSTVAFQQFTADWLGCSKTRTYCYISKCPGLYMSENEWRSCSQNVFQIFRARGHGDVRVGDLVGLYYKREGGNWFGCGGTLCEKNTCPGIASNEYGFDTPEHWYRCYGAVFKIYAHEKQLGDTINDQDDIMLLYLRDLNWIGAHGDNHHRDCPEDTRPPPDNKYDECDGEVYKIWKK